MLTGIWEALSICILSVPENQAQYWFARDSEVGSICMLPNNSRFGAIEEEHFQERNRLFSYLKKTNSNFLRREFGKNCRRFLEGFVTTILSTVGSCSLVGKDMSFFAPK